MIEAKKKNVKVHRQRRREDLKEKRVRRIRQHNMHIKDGESMKF